jgi:hypothetical protein
MVDNAWLAISNTRGWPERRGTLGSHLEVYCSSAGKYIDKKRSYKSVLF